MKIFEVGDGVSANVSGRFVDHLDAAIGSSRMTTLTSTLRDNVSGQVIGGRENLSVLNANGGTLDVSGNFSMDLDPEENDLIDAAIVGAELHVLSLSWTYDGGAKKGGKIVGIAVKKDE